MALRLHGKVSVFLEIQTKAHKGDMAECLGLSLHYLTKKRENPVEE